MLYFNTMLYPSDVLYHLAVSLASAGVVEDAGALALMHRVGEANRKAVAVTHPGFDGLDELDLVSQTLDGSKVKRGEHLRDEVEKLLLNTVDYNGLCHLDPETRRRVLRLVREAEERCRRSTGDLLRRAAEV